MIGIGPDLIPVTLGGKEKEGLVHNSNIRFQIFNVVGEALFKILDIILPHVENENTKASQSR